ncbi:hypothetical protein [Halococcus agarilyticus]|uniref:hypothetical protein n=1 Tax=Halococcus agarilyticus TaxID=1232219 RepID=UPI00067768C4|nr:hypothetical protein [Halococcus agarilyticus]
MSKRGLEGNTTVEIEPLIRTSVLAFVAVLGVPAGVYFGLHGSLDAGTANGFALGSSVIVALAVVALLLRPRQ